MSGVVHVANFLRDLEKRLEVSLSDETKEDLANLLLEQYNTTDLMTCLLEEQRITNKYLAVMLGDEIEKEDL